MSEEVVEIPDHVIRLMKKEEIPQVLDIWRETAQPLGTKCIDTWLEIDPEGFYVAATDSGEILGHCSAVFSNEDIAFMGMYAVRQKYRGKGIGPRIWKACLQHVGDRNAGVNAVPGKEELYRDRGGFPVEETEFVSVVCSNSKDVDPINLLDKVVGVDIRAFNEDEDLQLVLKYDEDLMGYSRDKIITLTVREEDSITFIALDGDGKCVGYGVSKLGIHGLGQVGPLYADSTEIAEVLLRGLIENHPKAKGLDLMIMNTNEGAKAIVEKIGLTIFEECARFYTRSKCHVDKSKVFGQLDLGFAPY